MEDLDLVLVIGELVGGLALFIYGMKLMTGALQSAAGTRMRTILGRITGRRVAGLTAGTAMGFMVHSGAGSVMIVGFINAGLLTLAQSIPLMLGNNVGTSLSMQLFSFQVGKYAFFAIGIGLMVATLFKKDAIRQGGLIVLGLGLLFLGMNLMKESAAPLKDAGFFNSFIEAGAAPGILATLSGFLLGIAGSALMQSSGALIGILFAMGAAGVFSSVAQPLPIVLGAHIGTCVVGLIGSIGTNIESRRSAMAHLMFNAIGGVLALAMAPLYVKAVQFAGGDMVHQIANVHTSVQVVNALIFLPFTNQFTALIRRMTPSTRLPVPKSNLEDKYLQTPEMAIVAVMQETRRMGTMVRKMLRQAMTGVVRPYSDQLFAAIEKEEESVDLLKEAINEYLFEISKRQLSQRQSLIIQHLMRTVADIERIGDHAESITEIVREKINRGVEFDTLSLSRLIDAFRKVDFLLDKMVESLNPANRVFGGHAQVLNSARIEYKQLSEAAREYYKFRIQNKEADAVHGMIYANLFSTMDRIVGHTKSVAKSERDPMFRVKLEKLDMPSPAMEKSMGSDQNYLFIETGIFNTHELDIKMLSFQPPDGNAEVNAPAITFDANSDPGPASE
ncbi:MAG TPA: Na/Pi symporter [Myxococcota bacterium]|nr:Na/Pi symporter [Myxococcota bacterium]HOA12824.1 Na/Pi symporter [Myxococcota bacterium]HOC98711.1 Na/Pi symporter [Myxococcota bacterium]HOH76528.1 Na/Pi symporter [Myxococcota bacterium]